MCNCDKKYSTVSNLLDAGKEVLKGVFTSYDPYLTSSEQSNRLEACRKCDYLGEFLGKEQCKICSCFIEPKTKMRSQSCPHPEGNKWELV